MSALSVASPVADAARAPLVETLDRWTVGQTGVIHKILIGHELRQRLQEVGLTEGERIQVRALAPFAGPIAVRVRGGQFSLRRADAAAIQVRRD